MIVKKSEWAWCCLANWGVKTEYLQGPKVLAQMPEYASVIGLQGVHHGSSIIEHWIYFEMIQGMGI